MSYFGTKLFKPIEYVSLRFRFLIFLEMCFCSESVRVLVARAGLLVLLERWRELISCQLESLLV